MIDYSCERQDSLSPMQTFKELMQKNPDKGEEEDVEYVVDWDDDSANTFISQAIDIIPSVIAALKEINREEDFICVLNNIANGKLGTLS